MDSCNVMALPIRGAVDYWAECEPDKAAFYEQGKKVSYREFRDDIQATQRALHSAGIRYGDRLAVVLPSDVQLAILLFASMKMGVNLVPCELMLTADDICARLEIIDPKLVFAQDPAHVEAASSRGYRVISKDGFAGSESFAEFLEDGAALPDTDVKVDGELGKCPVLTIFTSGSTGQPKGVMLSERNLEHANSSIQRALGCAKDDVLLTALPMSHIYGINSGILLPMLIGATSVLESRFNAEVMLDDIEAHRVSVFNGVPSMYQRIMQAQESRPRDLSTMRIGGIAGARCDGLERYREVLNCEARVLYGLTESPLIATTRPGDSLDTDKIGVGKFVDGVEGRIIDGEGNPLPVGEVGEIVCKSPGTMLGYLNTPAGDRTCVDAEGWIHTDDNGYVDENGYVHVVGRISSVINRGGYKVYPPEIEALYSEHPAIADCCAIGLHHVQLGQQIVLFVQLREPGLTPKALRDYAKGKLAKYKIPDQVILVDPMPLLPNGKRDKKVLEHIFETDETVFHSDEERLAKNR